MTGNVPAALLPVLTAWADARHLPLTVLPGAAVRETARRADGVPAMIIVGAEGDDAGAETLVGELKRDGRLQAVPAVMVITAAGGGLAARWLDAGADEVIASGVDGSEMRARLDAALRRSRRDVQVNPSTRLAGADALACAIAERIDQRVLFAACYADLDHFKEFNDRYGYAMGDDVIRTVARLLVDVVDEVSGAAGFVGHIGGDDFLFLVPLADVAPACDRIVRGADEILPLRYSAHDRQAGYFFGKDRRGRLDRVPLMTLSVGVVTNERRHFSCAVQVSELATEMKTYAKTLPGSVWAMDRRSDSEPVTLPEEKLP
ncbi:MAG: diguanylate cyclase [Gemmatimonadaceae bacterium]|nr:diguanylate cyclase [Gemmatimonadaceae bacterium]